MFCFIRVESLNISACIAKNIVQSPQGYFLFFCFRFGILCDMQNSQILIRILLLVPSTVFFFHLDKPHSITYGSYAAYHEIVLIWQFPIKYSMVTVICTHLFRMDHIYTAVLCRYWFASSQGPDGLSSSINVHSFPRG